MTDIVERLKAGTGGGKHWMELHEEAAAEIERLRAALNYISTADSGGELYPVGPSDTEYAEDGNTVLRHVGPWIFLRGKGATFLDAVEDAIKKDGPNVSDKRREASA